MRDQFIIDRNVFRALRGLGEHFLRHTVGVALTMLVLAMWLAQLSVLYSH